jgi:CRISPR/Cas system CMR-associated protein Cmr1 (group 7 of RAMP superfamily)
LLERLKEYFKEKSISLEKDYNRIKVKNVEHENYLKNAFNGITDMQLKLYFSIFIKKINRCII